MWKKDDLVLRMQGEREEVRRQGEVRGSERGWGPDHALGPDSS